MMHMPRIVATAAMPPISRGLNPALFFGGSWYNCDVLVSVQVCDGCTNKVVEVNLAVMPGGTVDDAVNTGECRDVERGLGVGRELGGSNGTFVRVPNVSRIVSMLMLEALHVSESSAMMPVIVSFR
jgi:hypothetical protein